MRILRNPDTYMLDKIAKIWYNYRKSKNERIHHVKTAEQEQAIFLPVFCRLFSSPLEKAQPHPHHVWLWSDLPATASSLTKSWSLAH